MKKITPIKQNTWHDWLINYIPKPIRKSVGSFKDKIVSLFKTNTPKQIVYGRGKKLSKPLDEYLNKIKPYLRNMIINIQNSDTWKIQLIVAINFISSKDAQEKHVMHSTSDNKKFSSYNVANEVVHELFQSLRSTYQRNLEISMRGSHFFLFISTFI